MNKVFLSYAHEDSGIARELLTNLAGTSVSGWMDQSDIASGGAISLKVRKSIQQASAVLVLVTARSIASHWVQFEIGAAWGMGKRVIPIIFGDTPIPDWVLQYQYIEVGLRTFADVANEVARVVSENIEPSGKPLQGENTMAKKKVFVSFDFNNDKSLKDFIIGQAKNADSPFEVSDHSLKEAKPEKDWLEHATAAIKRSDVFIVMLGPKTNSASGVKKEVAVAKELTKTRFQIIGYRDGSSDWAVPDAGRVYSWNWDNLKKLLG
jgi:hypothetical protein